jgi:hypothetical protein
VAANKRGRSIYGPYCTRQVTIWQAKPSEVSVVPQREGSM